jgi:hypothetical protein
MRRLVCVVLAGCGRLGFDAGDRPDGAAPDAGDPDGSASLLAITVPGEGADVGPHAEVAGTCAPGEVTLGGNDLIGEVTVPCAAGQWSAEVGFTAGFGTKKILATQGPATVMRGVSRVPQTIAKKAVRSGQRGSQGPGVNCTLVIGRPPDTQDGDLLIGMIFTDGGDTGSITVEGWTRLMVNGPTRVAFYKVASGEPDAFSFPIVAGSGPSDTCGSAGAIVSFTNVDVEDPIGAQSAVFTFDQQVVAPGVIASDPSMLVAVFGSNGPASGIVPQAGLDLVDGGAPEGSQPRSESGFANALVAWHSVDAGVTGTRSASIAGTAVAFAGGLIVLRPR